MSEYTFECTHVGVAVGKLTITVEAKDLISAINKMYELIEAADYTLLEEKKIHTSSSAVAGIIKKIL